MFYHSDLFMNFRLKLNKLKIPGPLFFNPFLIFPNFQLKIFVVYGKSIQCPQINNPD